MLYPPHFQALPLGAIRPQGCLLNQLQIQADGLTGHLDEFWPSVRDSRWISGDCEGWERGPYWLDGLIPLAFLLNDEKLRAKAQRWVNHIRREQHADGWPGVKEDEHGGEEISQLDPWPLFVLFKAFLQWHEATQDARIVPVLLRCARRVTALLQTEPLRSWAKTHGRISSGVCIVCTNFQENLSCSSWQQRVKRVTGRATTGTRISSI